MPAIHPDCVDRLGELAPDQQAMKILRRGWAADRARHVVATEALSFLCTKFTQDRKLSLSRRPCRGDPRERLRRARCVNVRLEIPDDHAARGCFEKWTQH